MALPSWVLALALGDRRCVHLEASEAGGLIARLSATPFGPKAIAKAALSIDVSGSDKTALKAVRGAARSRPVVFTPPPNLVLTQTVMVPETALENLAQAVRFGMSTWTPFDADMLVYHPDVIERRGEQVRIRIRMFPRKALEPYLKVARDAGAPIQLVAFDSDLKSCAEVEASSKRASPGKKLDLALLASAILLCGALLGTLHYNWASELDRLDADIRAEVAQQSKQRVVEQKLSQLEERRRAILTKRAKEPRLAEIVAKISNAAPETAEVSEFTWTGSQGRIVVRRAAALEMKTALEGAGFSLIGGPQNLGSDKAAIEIALRKAAP